MPPPALPTGAASRGHTSHGHGSSQRPAGGARPHSPIYKRGDQKYMEVPVGSQSWQDHPDGGDPVGRSGGTALCPWPLLSCRKGACLTLRLQPWPYSQARVRKAVVGGQGPGDRHLLCQLPCGPVSARASTSRVYRALGIGWPCTPLPNKGLASVSLQTTEAAGKYLPPDLTRGIAPSWPAVGQGSLRAGKVTGPSASLHPTALAKTCRAPCPLLVNQARALVAVMRGPT